jgi:hypothetical protein
MKLLTAQFSSASCYFPSTLYSTTQLQDSVICNMNPQSTPNSLEVFQLKTLPSRLAFSCSAEHIPTSLRHGRLYLITPATPYSGRSVNSWSFKYRPLPPPSYVHIMHSNCSSQTLSVRCFECEDHPTHLQKSKEGRSLYILIFMISVSGTRTEEIVIMDDSELQYGTI